MATSIKLKGDIKKIEAAIKSKATPKSLVPKLEAQLSKIKSELASLSSAKPKKEVTKTKVLSSLQKLKAKIKTTKSLSGYKKSGIDIKKDADVPALPLGRRVSKQTGNTYYEYRLNRADVKQPPKRYPKLGKGGYMAKGGALEHGLKVGDVIKLVSGDSIAIYNTKDKNSYRVNISEGKREMVSDMDFNKYAQGGRTTSAINRDRAYKSNQSWEQDYQRKSKPKNPKYKSSSDFFEGGGEMHRLFEEGEA